MQGICGQVHWHKKPMVAYGKNMPKNNQFSVFLPRKSKILPRKIICPFFWNIYPEKQNLPSHLVQPFCLHLPVQQMSKKTASMVTSACIRTWVCNFKRDSMIAHSECHITKFWLMHYNHNNRCPWEFFKLPGALPRTRRGDASPRWTCSVPQPATRLAPLTCSSTPVGVIMPVRSIFH